MEWVTDLVSYFNTAQDIFWEWWKQTLFIDFPGWFISVIDWTIARVVEVILENVASVFGAIPAPGYGDDICEAWSNVPDAIAGILGAVHFGTGLVMIMSAYGLRFLIRRLPVIG